jgi:hypothetical protein
MGLMKIVPKPVTGALAALILLAALVAPVGGPSGSAGAAEGDGTVQAAADASGEYTPIAPFRALDTRISSGPLTPGGSIDLTVVGQGGIPGSGVAAVVANVTVTGPSESGHLTVWPSGQAKPATSNLNFVAGQTVPNLVTVKVGASGRISIANSAGFTHVVVDLAGWYSSASGPAGERYHPSSPRRLIDTRDGTGGTSGPVGPGASLNLFMGQGGAGLPSAARAVAVNVTVTQPSAAGHIIAFPRDVSRPEASNLNFVPGLTVANLVVVKISSDGWVSFYNSAGSTHLVIDLVGYYGGSKTGDEGRFVPLTPARLLDTRETNAPLPPGGITQVTIAGRGGVPSSGISAVVANVTATQPTESGHFTVYPTANTVPLASTLNFAPGQTVPNLAMVGPMNGNLNIANAAGWTHALVDVFGYFTGGVTLGFDTCEVPSVQQMATWKASSPYSVVGIYIGPLPDGPGVRACRNLPLDTPSWVNQVTGQGWRLIPTYVGRQAPCTDFRVVIDPPVARTQGIEAADDAIVRATAAGLAQGTPIYFDLEYYSTSVSGCSAAVREFLDGWVDRLHDRGYLAGLYSSLSAGIADHVQALGAGYTPMDAIWIAAWNDTPNIYGFGSYGLPDGYWNQHQRIHQYQGGHNETWGGVTLNIDTNVIDGPTAP